MVELHLYHGSNRIIERPDPLKSRRYNDYGTGFYCTEHPALAREWAVSERADGYVNSYKLEMDGLKILNLNTEEDQILHWLALLMNYRIVRLSTPLMKRASEWLRERYLIDLSHYDIVCGYRADDSYFSFARSFVNNEISLRQLTLAMRLGELGEQVVLKSPEAYGRIRFMSYEAVDHTVYYVLRKKRDLKARSAWQEILKTEEKDDVYVRDLMKS